jgi:hypothetical protein
MSQVYYYLNLKHLDPLVYISLVATIKLSVFGTSQIALNARCGV